MKQDLIIKAMAEIKKSELLGTPLEVNALGAFEGADRFDTSTASWLPAIMSPDDDIIPNKNMIDGRSVDLFMNDAFVRAGINLHRDGIVGAFYRLNCKPRIKILGLEDEWEAEFTEEVEELYTNYAESANCWRMRLDDRRLRD